MEAQIQVLNNDYNATGIHFRLVKTTSIKSIDWFESAYPGSFNSTTGSLGTVAIPSAYYRNPKSDGVMTRRSTVTNGSRTNYGVGRTLMHEVGHWLVLFHTFKSESEDGVGDNIADTPPQASGSDGCAKQRDSGPGDKPHLIFLLLPSLTRSDRQLYGQLVGLMHGLVHPWSSDQDEGE
ncbi:hypothetical protein D9613_006401 [Agrocybe pediades]|uniref:Peptidase M43 pregnancy-associated plasma-A domain-containing protein n=1 Tax=Agrocybe pediades TaxID=84607 RepID=A0A8H4VRA2_9AGAR|nr:hypothetical protein D9613_006401 [Agrocybe pediades]